jgi:hypothetical protein
MMKNSTLMDDDELMAREPDVKRLHDAYALLSANRPQGIAELEELANRGSVMSMLYLADAYQRGQGSDPIRAEKWYKSAYEAGSSTALFGLGAFYYRLRNYDAAEKIFADGVSKDDGVSMYWLASIYTVDSRHHGKSAQIKDLLERSIALGQIHAKHGLGLLFMKGRYGLRNVPRGFYLFFSGIFEAFKVTYRDPSSRRLW